MNNKISASHKHSRRNFEVIINCKLHATLVAYVEASSKEHVEATFGNIIKNIHPNVVLWPAPAVPVEISVPPELTEFDLILVDETKNYPPASVPRSERGEP